MYRAGGWAAALLLSMGVWVVSAGDVDAAAPELAQSSSAGEQALPHFDDVVIQMLDPDVPLPQRQRALEQVREAAQLRNGLALYLLGCVYLLGKEHPAALVDQDLQQAKRYLSNASVNGYLIAMPLLTEVELSMQNPQAAIIWAYLANHYQNVERKGRDQNASRVRAAYYPELIERSTRALGEAYDADKVLGDVNAFLKRYDTQIRESMDGAKSPIPDSMLPERGFKIDLKSFPMFDSSGLRMAIDYKASTSEGMVTFYSGVSRKGTVKRVIFVSSMQEPRYVRDLMRYVQAAIWDEAGSDDPEIRWVLTTLTANAPMRRLFN